MTDILKGKVALVTGGSRGIGKEVAKKLASQGADIAIFYIGNPQEAEEAVAEISAMGVKVRDYVCDVSKLSETEPMVQEVIKEFGTVDILINNAGITRDGLVIKMTEADYDAVLDINLKGAFNMIKSCYKTFMRKRSGKIVNIASVSGILGNAGQANYSASKAGMIGLTKSIARELAGRNVNCNAVAPGFIATNMTEDFGEGDALFDNIPMKRMGTTEELAKAVSFLAGPDSDYITGEVLKVDGGLAM
jgi:3-oxoacyl-(acyl-carrier-protein) reductase